MDVEGGNAHQQEVQQHLARYACQQGIHGNALLTAALQDAAGGLHHGEQADGHGAHLQQLARDGQVLGGVAARVKQEQDGLGQDAHAHRAGKTDHCRDAQTRDALAGYIVLVAARHAGGYRGHQIGAHGHGQGGGHVDQRQHHAGVQSVAHQRLGGIHAAAFHQVGQHKAVDPPCQGHDARAQGDGDGDGSQADGDALAGKHGCAFILRHLGEGTAAEQVLDSHVQQGRALGNGGAQQRPCCAQRGPARAHAPDGHG